MSRRVGLPELPLEAWEPTRDTLHLWCQIVGKVKLASTPPRNHWWNVPLYVDARGLTTRTLRHDASAFRIDFDFVDHELVLTADMGEPRRLRLEDGLSVADFDRRLHALLAELGLDVAIREEPFATPISEIPFTEDAGHAAYDPEYAARFWRALLWIDNVYDEFSGWYCGKQSPVHLFWHSFDLAVSRFSGRPAPDVPGADPVSREAYSHEVISFGFWPGDPRTRFPAFYSYTAPEPEALTEMPLKPEAAYWQEVPNGHLALLPYEVVRVADDPRAMLLAFLESAYQAGAGAAGWDRAALTSSWCPTPRQLEELYLR
jgi:hypothetical protein